MRASVIDLGYNSLKMVGYEVRSEDSFRVYDQRGSLTRLGEGLNQTGFLGEEAMARTLRELELLKEVNRISHVENILAIATSPLREAGNGPSFQKDAEALLGLKFKVLSGKEEALFSYIGAARATRFPDVLFFDLGGGSLELTYARGLPREEDTLTLPLGALRMTELYGTGRPAVLEEGLRQDEAEDSRSSCRQGRARAHQRDGPAWGRGDDQGPGQVRPVDEGLPAQQAAQLPSSAPSPSPR